jgi:hypothetical protein
MFQAYFMLEIDISLWDHPEVCSIINTYSQDVYVENLPEGVMGGLAYTGGRCHGLFPNKPA